MIYIVLATLTLGAAYICRPSLRCLANWRTASNGCRLAAALTLLCWTTAGVVAFGPLPGIPLAGPLAVASYIALTALVLYRERRG